MPNFGNNTIGNRDESFAGSCVGLCKTECVHLAVDGEVVVRLWVYGVSFELGATCDLALYTFADGAPAARLAVVTVELPWPNPGWIYGLVNVPLVAGTSYTVAAGNFSAATHLYYQLNDSSNAEAIHSAQELADPFGAYAFGNDLPSISADYLPTHVGILSAVVKRATSAIAGTFTAPTFSGMMAAAAKRATSYLAGTFTKPVYSGVLAAIAKKATAAIAGTFAAHIGILAAVAKRATASISAQFTPPVYSGTVAAVAERATAAITGVFAEMPIYDGVLAAIAKRATAAISGDLRFVGTLAGTVGGATGILVGLVGDFSYHHRVEARGLYRIFAPPAYRFYRSADGPPAENAAPFAENASLPHTPADTFADGVWYLACSYFNGVLDSGFLPVGPHGETYLVLAIVDGQAVGARPGGPLNWRLEAKVGGVVAVIAVYCEEGSQRAGEWAIAYTIGGGTPTLDDPDLTQTIPAHGLAILTSDLPAAESGALVTVRLQTRRNDGTNEAPAWVYSETGDVLTIHADALGPSVPLAAERWPGLLVESEP
jgi:hypothetical protein